MELNIPRVQRAVRPAQREDATGLRAFPGSLVEPCDPQTHLRRRELSILGHAQPERRRVGLRDGGERKTHDARRPVHDCVRRDLRRRDERLRVDGEPAHRDGVLCDQAADFTGPVDDLRGDALALYCDELEAGGFGSVVGRDAVVTAVAAGRCKPQIG